MLAGTLALASLGRQPLGASPPENPQITFGFSLYGMQKLPVAEALAQCARIGFDAVELVCMPEWETAPEKLSVEARNELKQRLIDANLILPALMENLPLLVDAEKRLVHRNRLKAAAELGHALSGEKPPVIETILGGKPADWEAAKNEMVAELGTWAEVAAESRTIIAVKPHVSGSLHTPDGADWLIRQVNSPWIRLAYDFSHYQVQGFVLKQSLELLLPHSVFIHVKDNVGVDGQVRFGLPGDGTIDYATYFSTVKSSGYRGTIMVEVSAQLHRLPDYDPIAAAEKSYTNLAERLKQSELWSPKA